MDGDLEGTFSEELRRFGVSNDALPRVLTQFQRYRQELLDWNARINLTAITNPEEVLSKHFLDSLSLLQVYDRPQTRLIDIGSGAGFPGLPLKIVRPEWQVTLLEATGKKVAFLQHMIESLEISGISAIHARAEDLAQQREYRAAFDLVAARAVAALPILLEYAAPFCRVGGTSVLYKKGDLAEELLQGKRAARLLGVSPPVDQPVTLPGLADDRRLLLWRQHAPCPPQYPRSYAAMLKKPLA
jgi:16S rRNA (guanine527-N7)-methyltransferase